MIQVKQISRGTFFHDGDVNVLYNDRSQKPLIGLKILRQKRHGIVTEHASCFFTLEKFNMADGLLLFMHGNCNIISL